VPRAKTGAYGLLFPAGVTWGTGTFVEGFRLLIVGTSTPQIATDNGKLNLTGQGIKDAFGFYVDLINNDLLERTQLTQKMYVDLQQFCFHCLPVFSSKTESGAE
jgi:ABC-type glycerol-3-phosphate transport system substrate-binding protein